MNSSTAWNYTIDDSSSMLNYWPHGDGGLGNWTTLGWQPYYAQAGGLITVSDGGGKESIGPSLHITSFPGASVELAFYGTAIYIYGTANCTYDVTIDADTVSDISATGDLLFFQSLDLGPHSVNLTAHPTPNSDEVMSFDYAVITNNIQGTQLPIPVVYDNQNTSVLTYQGDWSTGNDPQIPSTESPKPFHKTSLPGSSVSLDFEGIAVAINGTRDWGSYTYTVTLDGETSAFNASTMWLVGDATLFFMSGLTNTNHTLEMINTGFTNSLLWLNSITAFQLNSTAPTTASPSSVSPPPAPANPSSIAPPPPPAPTPHSQNDTSSSHKTNVGAIAGGVVGGIAVLLIAIAALLFWRRRRGSRVLSHANVEPWMVPRNPTLPTVPTIYSATAKTPSTIFTGGYRAKDRPLYQESAPVVLVPPVSASVSVSMSDTPVVSPVSAGSQPVEGYGGGQVNVDQIIELIAQRIDRPAPAAPSSDHEPPPVYPQYQ